MTSTWVLDDGLQLVRALQPETRRFGYHLALGGGVLNKGWSDKDLDLYFLPLDNEVKPQPQELLDWLVELWGYATPINSSADTGGNWDFVEVIRPDGGIELQRIDRGPQPVSAYKHKVKFHRVGGERIDVFIL